MSRQLYILSGPSNVGKTTWATNFVKDKEDCEIISMDKLSKELKNTHTKVEIDKALWIELAKLIRNSQAKIVIVDGLALTPKHRAWYVDNFSNVFNELILVSITSTIDVSRERNKNRVGQIISSKLLDKTYSAFIPPTKEEELIFTKIIKIEN